ncbi:MAG: Ig-like domain-containing protein [Bacteroidales bacterium]|nr:Ig-like domain-containing protein [Bacteroidales bacterium]
MVKFATNSLTFWLTFLAILLVLIRCANPVMPTGGLKDEVPPEAVSSVPANFSVNVQGKSISITFNEFVKLDKINEQVLISPPPATNPEFRLRGKTLTVRFEDELMPSTTYTVFFGEAIVDLTENNPLSGYTFVFSTGSVLDSMSLKGQVYNAFDLKAAENAYVLLYLLNNDTIPVDSLPYLVKPYYVARTNKLGAFRFQNLKDDAFKMFVLSDLNSNFIYDMPGEMIAFSDTLVRPIYVKPPILDSVLKPDSISKVKTVNAIADSVSAIIDTIPETVKLRLALFQETDSTQKLLRAEIVKPGLLRFAFRQNARDISIESLQPLPDSFDLMPFFSANSDTLLWYFRQNVLDSIHLSIQQDTLLNDTLHISLKPRQAAQARRIIPKESDKKGDFLNYTTNTTGRRLEINEALKFTFDYPVTLLRDRDSARIITNADTTFRTLQFEKHDSIGLVYKLAHNFETESSYSLQIPDSCFLGLNGLWNDTIRLSFKVPALTDYGNLFLKLEFESEPHIILQLLGSKDVVVREYYLSKEQTIQMENLQPGKYRLKAIYDRNNNKRWDTGNYLKGIQPEKVLFFKKELEIRANWDFEESWLLE